MIFKSINIHNNILFLVRTFFFSVLVEIINRSVQGTDTYMH